MGESAMRPGRCVAPGKCLASMMGSPAPPCSTRPPRIQGSPASAAAAREASSPTIMSSCTWVTALPRSPKVRNGMDPAVMVWKWVMRYRPSRSCSTPDNRSSRGVSMAPAATTT